MDNARVFLDQQIAQYERQLREAEGRLAEFRTKYVDLLPSDAGVSRLESARGQVAALQGQLTDVLARRDMMRRQLAATPAELNIESDPPVILPGFGAAAPATMLAQAEAKLAELRLRYTEQHPEVIAARNQVAELKAAAAAVPPQESAAAAMARELAAMPKPRPRTMPNPVYEPLHMQLLDQDLTVASLQRQMAEATRERDRLEEIAHGVPGLQAQFANLNRDYDVLHRNYTELLSRRESMRLAAAADTEAEKVKTEIIDPPQVPQIPVAPKRGMLLSLVLIAGLGSGLGLAILLLQFDQSFHSVEDLRVLGLPVVGGISMRGAGVPLQRRLLSAASFAMSVLLLFAVYGGLLYRLLQTPDMA
jgi:polysaccharide chain length determinant protein (PEP-CTERM system associated)